MNYCVVARDNFGRSGEVHGRNEYIVTRVPLSAYQCGRICEALNEDPSQQTYYAVEPFDYTPVKFEV